MMKVGLTRVGSISSLKMPSMRSVQLRPVVPEIVDHRTSPVCGSCLNTAAALSERHLVGAFQSGRVRRYIQHTLDAADGCVLEIILKDTHTCEHHPERFDRWTRIAREEVRRQG